MLKTPSMEHFAVSLFFIKPIPPKYFPHDPLNKVSATNTAAKTSAKQIRLHSGHFNLLWLIKKIADESKDHELETVEGKKYVVALNKLEKVFVWYVTQELSEQTDETKTAAVKFLSNLLTSLRDTGHLGFVKKETSYYYLGEKGMKLFNENRQGRKLQVKNFFRESSLTRKQFKEVVQTLQVLTPRLWRKILDESENIQIPKKNKKI